jgi:hypothetical protein
MLRGLISCTGSSPVNLFRRGRFKLQGGGMLDGITTNLLVNMGSSGLLTIVVWMIFTGRLVTRREANHLIEELNHWRTAFIQEQENTQALMETGLVTRDLLRALPLQSHGGDHDT